MRDNMTPKANAASTNGGNTTSNCSHEELKPKVTITFEQTRYQKKGPPSTSTTIKACTNIPILGNVTVRDPDQYPSSKFHWRKFQLINSIPLWNQYHHKTVLIPSTERVMTSQHYQKMALTLRDRSLNCKPGSSIGMQTCFPVLKRSHLL